MNEVIAKYAERKTTNLSYMLNVFSIFQTLAVVSKPAIRGSLPDEQIPFIVLGENAIFLLFPLLLAFVALLLAFCKPKSLHAMALSLVCISVNLYLLGGEGLEFLF